MLTPADAGSSRTSQDMLGNSIVQCAIATTASLASLSLLSLLCLRCKRKPKTIHEEAQIYNPHTFQRGGSRFAVTRSKTVMKANQMTLSSNEGACPALYAIAGSPPKIWEHIYVDPLPTTVYENEQMASRIGDADPTEPHYVNVADAAPTDDDADDYENSDFLVQKACGLENDLLYENQQEAEGDTPPFLSGRGRRQVSVVRGHHP
ncbi:uncharacterized protein LOC127588022 isoform X3 [Hippocampus zosterae]|uniref:uncharacterized protein LOC127588022 isoform X3 n=1 Tax=Hippocampus zosterae TaxID=109293 RepID=UPI00223CF6FD|nr:uncharacterized protein LOC127588022 isoform X3 [Hippocampus zosterae]